MADDETAADRSRRPRAPLRVQPRRRARARAETTISRSAAVQDSQIEEFAVEHAGSDPTGPTPTPLRRRPRRTTGCRAAPVRSSSEARTRGAEAARRPRSARKSAAKKLVGLKIGASQIAAAQVVNNGAPELVDAFREPLEPGLVVSGEIRDPEALGDALKRFFDLHKLPKRGVRLGVSNNRIGVRIFEIEGVADAAAARERHPLPGRGGSADSARPGRPRLRRPR